MGPSASNEYLCTHDELPAWCHDNDFVITGYRRPGGTYADAKDKGKVTHGQLNGHASAVASDGKSLRKPRLRAKASEPFARSDERKTVTGVETVSEETILFEHDTLQKCWNSIWLYWHNETVNIHTHLWGALAAVLLAFLHTLHYLDLLPSFLNPLAHHPIFSPRSFPARVLTVTEPTSFAGRLRSAVSLSSTLGAGQAHVASKGASILTSTTSTLVHRGGGGMAGSLLRRPAPLNQVLQFDMPLTATHIATAWSRPPHALDIISFTAFFVGAAACLSFSATFHTLQAHSSDVAKRCHQLDYVGIVAMICGSFVPALFYGFHCHPYLQRMYTLANLSLGALATFLVINPSYATPAYRPVRTTIFLSHGLSAVFPTAHVLMLYGHENVAKMMGVNFLAASGALYVVGALLYVFRVPERFAPGRFDYIGASHQIFHVFILLAAFAHYVSIRRGYAFWHTVEAIGSDRSAAAVCTTLEQWRG
ncbi:HlyIII-domain-containing protein [Tilletiaria anomala UBC 951]|uniref:HlyIII-domain-containing protein n=1 Tax=Tilletiaria anomala (strain ATCC 24038 / CBS 436.72 / UBC 951) TaxID=1037660 RepID=A0A066W7S7_TILAU|nr:HlyIII-domain-containing protein [Tilletiaria anomala UBC 951]KDN47139.1 HlyIII-domain-containing protein [Tilletiaria anomala UBC 951]